MFQINHECYIFRTIKFVSSGASYIVMIPAIVWGISSSVSFLQLINILYFHYYFVFERPFTRFLNVHEPQNQDDRYTGASNAHELGRRNSSYLDSVRPSLVISSTQGRSPSLKTVNSLAGFSGTKKNLFFVRVNTGLAKQIDYV